ncbi:hypothetical protein, partial [Facilibium subflavum]|uniref:hypothetical protein n=1 Tax=Facilibium subflavum TaxID=2219058 RepID=UPI001AAC5182
AEEILLARKTIIIILDDDPCMHKLWQRTIENALPTDNQVSIELAHFNTIDAFREWHKKAKESAYYCYFIDYNLGGDLTGMNLIEEYSLSTCSYLVTGQYDDQLLMGNCQHKGIKMIPKPLVAYLPFYYYPNEPDFILIDDNKDLGQAWQLKASVCNKALSYFDNIFKFLRFIAYYPSSTPIYIDSDLGSDQKGEEWAKFIYDAGFREIYIATGLPERFNRQEQAYWVKAICNKEPPF